MKITRRQFIGTSALGASALGLAACGGSGSSNGGSDSSILIGMMGPYSGAVAQYGLAVRDGAQLYIDQVNDKGGINGKKIEVNTQDEKGDATEAINVYKAMVEAGVNGIIGDVTSTPTIAVAQTSVADNMPCVTASATAPDVINYGKNMFRACITDPFQGRVMANFAKKQGYKKIATIFNSGGDYEAGVEKAFVEQAGKNGIEITSEQGYPDGAVDFNAQLTAILATNPDAILSPNYYQDSGKIVTQARSLGYKGVFLGADGWANIVGGDQDYASAADLEGCFYDASFSASNDAENVQHFIKAFNDKYNTQPSNFNALGYDAAMLLLAGVEAAEKSGAKAGTDEYKQAIIDGIAGGSVDGVTGKISYSGTGDPVKSTLIITFKGGKEVISDTIAE